jgi:hypothetical protein
VRTAGDPSAILGMTCAARDDDDLRSGRLQILNRLN